MEEKAKKDANKNTTPTEEEPTSTVLPATAIQTQETDSTEDRGEVEDIETGEISGELSELEQQKLAAGKRKGVVT